MARIYKWTGLPAIFKNLDPHREIITALEQCLNRLDRLPKDYAYRQRTEKLVRERLHIVKTTPKIEDVEKKIKGGYAEEIYLHAKNEAQLADKMYEWKPWEQLISKEPPNQWTWPPVN